MNSLQRSKEVSYLMFEESKSHQLYFCYELTAKILASLAGQVSIKCDAGGICVRIYPSIKQRLIPDNALEFEECLLQKDGLVNRDILLFLREKLYRSKRSKQLAATRGPAGIDILMPVHNGSKTVGETLVKLLSALEISTQVSARIIICLDHCTDDSEQVVHRVLSNYDRCDAEVIFNPDETGKASALNYSFLKSSAPILYFIDDDIGIEVETISALLDELQHDPNTKIVFSPLLPARINNLNPWRKFVYWIFSMKYELDIYGHNTEILRGASIMMARETYIKFPKNIINDDEFLGAIYRNMISEEPSAKVIINSVTSLKDYYRRFLRIKSGSHQLKLYVSSFALSERSKFKLDKNYVARLNVIQKIRFILYRIVRFTVKSLVNYKLRNGQEADWTRISQ